MNTALIHELSAFLHKRGWTLAVAESCTGGLLGDMITDLPGSSAFFRGGVTAYSDHVKANILGVPLATLEGKGAVSSKAALALARGIRTILDSSVGVAVTGIAGPEGGSPEKPVGLVYIAVLTPRKEEVRRFIFHGTRRDIKLQAAQRALRLIMSSG
ncbi:MAG: CinA family protein [Candidatus Euphemobacter frigidus]|nr:CinA family protein [Candidatus Euphemobacter frigidus]MDP8275301.1 CinA family protein [Candidatus Euphemobacter frigidus]